MEGEEGPEIVAAPGLAIAALGHPGQGKQAGSPGPEGRMQPEGQAAATEEGRVDQFPADQGGKELQIRQREIRPAEPGAACRQGRLGLRQGGKQLGLGPVVTKPSVSSPTVK